MKILVIMQFFQPEPVLRGLSLMKELQKLGNDIEVLTGFPNYPQGKIYQGYKQKLIKREIMDGVKVTRIPLYPSHDSNGVRRILNYLSFSISCLLIGPFIVKKPDIIYAYHPPATIFLPSIFFKLLYRKPCIFDIQDLWPDTLFSTAMLSNSILFYAIDYFCKIAYCFADKILVISPGFKRVLQCLGVPAKKISVVFNWADDNSIHIHSEKTEYISRLAFEDYFTIMFAGNMGKAQALSSVIEAAALVENINNKVRFIFVGDGVEEEALKKKVKTLNLTNTIFLPRQPIEKIGDMLSRADVLLVHLKNDPLFEITIPSKIQTYLSIGKPILAAVKGDAANLVIASHSGMVCQPEDPEGIARAVILMASTDKKVLEEMGKNGKEYYINNLSLSIGARNIKSNILDLLK